jgi:hypothetical protein
VALSAFCPTCQRTVYFDDGDTPVCPVCSSPLLEATGNNNEETVRDSQTDGAK